MSGFITPYVTLLLGVTLLLLAVLGVAETVVHRRNLAKIPHRVHVNGTRGKSSVTRLIAAGLRAGGLRTVAKVTGVLPRVILPDGEDLPVYRPARANIMEQKRIVALAAANGCDVLVVECMALQPPLQWLSEDKLIRATLGVITNARADHLDVMGPTARDVALCLVGMVPVRGVLYTAERKLLDVFEMACADRGSTLHPTRLDEVEAITAEDLAGFSYMEHAENVALALNVCAALGVERGVALRGMWRADPDPGVTIDVPVHFFGRDLVLVNAFAANDPESTEGLWERALERHAGAKTRIALFNCRADRLDRSVQLAEAYAGWTQADHVVLMGTGTFCFARFAARHGVNRLNILDLEGASPEDIFEHLVEIAGESAVIVGMANIAGPGLGLVRTFKNRSLPGAAFIPKEPAAAPTPTEVSA